MSESDEEIQQNELLALQSIYGERQMVLSPGKNGGRLAVYIELPEDFKIAYPSVNIDAKGEQAVASEEEPPYAELNIHYLPPVILNFELPANYPSEVPPKYTLTCKWLTLLQLSELGKNLDTLWNEQGCGSEILFEWMQFLNDNTMSCLHISSPLVLPRVSSKSVNQASSEQQQNCSYGRSVSHDISSLEKLVSFLITYDSQESTRTFNTTYFNCGVCFFEKLGIDCVTFRQCKHVYCTDCVTDYFTVQITDGSVRSLNCPEIECESQADPNMVKKLVSAELYEKYDKLLLQTTLDCMDDMTYCPRTSCLAAVLHESDARNMGRCPVCNFVFCVLCQRTYHGVTGCAIKSKELLSLREEYLNGNEKQRAALEKKYGKVRLLEAVEEHFSQAWLEKYSKKCPVCGYGIQKIDGCNKMACFKCKAFFCWLCKKVLAKNDPYGHFNDERSICMGKLFDGVEDVGDSDDEFDFF